MIASISGNIIHLTQSSLVIEAAGVGYVVSITPETAKSLKVGQSTKLFTSMIVREDSHSLFGFLAFEELETFDLLRSVTGVGPKSALGVLTELRVDEIANAVSNESDSVFRAVTGIGPKTAKLIVLTLAGKFKFSKLAGENSSFIESTEVINALVGLGWSEQLAKTAVSEVSELAAGKDEKLKLALQYLATTKGSGGVRS